MRRGFMLFGHLQKQLCMELLEYFDQTAVLEPIRALEQEGLYQVMEFVFDLRLLGEQKDKTGRTCKRTLFNNLKSVHESFGCCKLQFVVVDMEKKAPI